MGQLLLKMLVGGVSGLLIWMLFEPSAPVSSVGDAWASWEQWFITALGGGIGLTVGALNGWMQGSRAHLLRGAGLGLVFGLIGGPLGHSIGGSLSIAVFGNVLGDPTVNVATRTFARLLALAPLGMFIGLAIGASSLNVRRMVQGAIGGLIGGAIGGGLFDTVASVVGSFSLTVQNVHGGHTGEVGTVSRALYATLVGGLIALFIGIVDLLARTAWVRLVVGRNEGKEWPVDAQQTFIGRNERANIPLFGDPNIAPMHACIIKQGAGAYMLADGGSPIGTFLNGQRIQQAPLFHGAQIQVGSYALQFLMKHGAAPVRGPEAFNQAYSIQNQPQAQVTGAVPYAAPNPGSLYGSAPAPTAAAPSGAFAAQQPTVAFPSASQPTQAYANPAGGFSLAAVDGPLVGQRFAVRAQIELGRESASVPMGFDTGASRRHASISPTPAGLMVTDLNSTNGTFVNGQRVQTASAGPGDLIKIGGTTFRVEPG